MILNAANALPTTSTGTLLSHLFTHNHLDVVLSLFIGVRCTCSYAPFLVTFILNLACCDLPICVPPLSTYHPWSSLIFLDANNNIQKPHLKHTSSHPSTQVALCLRRPPSPLPSPPSNLLLTSPPALLPTLMACP